MIIPTLGGNIQRKRESLSMTQKDLARRVKIGQSFIAQIESGKKVPDPKVFVHIIEILKFTYKEALELKELYIYKKYASLRWIDSALQAIYEDEWLPEAEKSLKKNKS
jgi:predicted transcriptional regulator